MEPEKRPSLGDYESNIQIREMSGSDSEKHYRVVWRGVSGSAETVPKALHILAEKIERIE